MNAAQRRKARREEQRAAGRPEHADRYAEKPRGAERELAEALAALLERFGPQVPR